MRIEPDSDDWPEGIPLTLKRGAKLPEIRMNQESVTKQDTYRSIAPNADCPRREPGRASVGDSRGLPVDDDRRQAIGVAKSSGE